MQSSEKVARLRKSMAKQGIDAYVITKFDPHQSEYVPPHWNAVREISGFTGSAGTVVVTANHAGLWTDGRYYLQAEAQLAGSGIELHRAADVGVKDFEQFALDEVPEGGVIGIDGRTTSASSVKALLGKMEKNGQKLRSDLDMVGELWENRPEPPSNPVFEHDLGYCGISRMDKINSLREKMAEDRANTYVLSSLDDIAWLFNLRGSEVDTLFTAFAVIEEKSATLFINPGKIADVRASLERDGVTLRAYEDVYAYLEGLEKGVFMLNPDKTGYALYARLEGRKLIEKTPDLTTEMKAVKNKTELESLEKCHVIDGVAMVRFIKWVKANAGSGKVTERGIVEKLKELRSLSDEYLGTSFDTIAGYNENGAIIHYNPVEADSRVVLDAKGIVLVDSGGEYYCGTTDITRTIALGEVNEKVKRDFTLVLKGHIALARAVFPYGTSGIQLDALARQFLWSHGIDYKTGTGHGIGFCLCVHEGPQNIAKARSPYKIEPGMTTSNEPGVYRSGEYGIRTENILLSEEHSETEFGRFLKFRTISYCPIDLELVERGLLDADELAWLNDYHHMVYEKLSPELSPDDAKWLRNETREL